jgi:2-dehydro-3-deoxyglucarate aldolase
MNTDSNQPNASGLSALQSKIRSGRLSLGSWITLGHASIGEIFARAGFDWLVIDLEHSVIGIDLAGDLIRTIDLCGVAPLVRLTSNDPDQIKRVMDMGAHGIIVPMVNSAADAAAAVAATRYPPRGTRGVGLGRAQGYGPGFQDYLAWQADGPIVIVQIEHRDAVSQLDSILSVPGVDGFMIGPYDLSCSMGIPGEFANPEYVSVLEKIRETGRRLGRPAGLHIVEPDLDSLEQAIRDGYSIIAYSVDFRMLDVGARQAVERAKEFSR